jgi:hypothetical protein
MEFSGVGGRKFQKILHLSDAVSTRPCDHYRSSGGKKGETP